MQEAAENHAKVSSPLQCSVMSGSCRVRCLTLASLLSWVGIAKWKLECNLKRSICQALSVCGSNCVCQTYMMRCVVRTPAGACVIFSAQNDMMPQPVVPHEAGQLSGSISHANGSKRINAGIQRGKTSTEEVNSSPRTPGNSRSARVKFSSFLHVHCVGPTRRCTVIQTRLQM